MFFGAKMGHLSSIKFYGKCILQIQRGCHLSISDGFRCYSGRRMSMGNCCCSKIVVLKDSTLSIGKMSGISNTIIQCKERITIGDYVNIGDGCLIMDNDFHSSNWEIRMHRNDGTYAKSSPITINDHVFIGARSIVCKGVTIGAHSIIAAGSVVVRNVPDNEIWGGNPAVYIKKIDQ